MTPRISLRSECGINGLANGQVGVGPRSPDGSPFLFEVLGAAGPESSQQAAAGPPELSLDFARRLGSTSLESCPPPALDRRRWTEAVGPDFMVRGPSYLTTRVKVPSARQVRPCLLSWKEFVVGVQIDPASPAAAAAIAGFFRRSKAFSQGLALLFGFGVSGFSSRGCRKCAEEISLRVRGVATIRVVQKYLYYFSIEAGKLQRPTTYLRPAPTLLHAVANTKLVCVRRRDSDDRSRYCCTRV